MSRARISLRRLAAERGADPELAILILADLGIHISHPDHDVPPSKLGRARKALGLHTDVRALEAFADRAQLTKEEARTILAGEGIALEHARVPRRLRHNVEVALRLRPAPALPEAPPPTHAPSTASEAQNAPLTVEEIQRELRKTKRGRDELNWGRIGPVEPLRFLTTGDVEFIHTRLEEDFAGSRDPISPPGIKSRNLLESALFRPHTSLGGIPKYPTVATSGAALFHSVALNHAFHNGNKRTALVALVVFLDKHGYVITLDQDELYEYVVAVADHRILKTSTGHDAERVADQEAYAIARWLQSNIRRLRKGDVCIKFRDLRQILGSYECEFETVPGNRLNIFRGSEKSQVYHNGNDNRDVEPNSIHKIRKDLSLDESHGYDSDIFYNALPRIDDFILKYRRVLDRLAKV